MEQFLNDHNLNILNEGNKPTFHRVNCATHIDITAVSNSVIPLVKGWQVLEEEMFSDHYCLYTKLNPAKTFKRKRLNLKKTDWSSFFKILNKLDWSITNLSSPTEVEGACQYFSNSLLKALTTSTPTTYISGAHRKESWWSEELRQTRRELRATKRLLNTNHDLLDTYNNLKTSYAKAIRAAKRDSWLKFLEEIQKLPEASRLAKVLTKAKATPVGLTNGRNGVPAWNKTTSTQNLMSNLFPGITRMPPPQPTTHTHTQNVGTDVSWITVDTVANTISNLTA